MIYGNKFLDNNLLLSESIILKEEENINLLINDLSIVSEDSIDKIHEFIKDKIDELFDRINFYIDKFISFIKVKILKLGNRILKKLDESINGKFEVKDLPAIESEYKKDFDNGGEYKEIIESVFIESNTEKKVAFLSFKSPRTVFEKWTEYINRDLDEAADFMESAQKYLDDSVEYVNGNHTDNLKNKLDEYNKQFDKKTDRDQENEKNNFTDVLLYDLKEVKSFKDEQKFSTSNGYFSVDFFDVYDKENIKEMRSILFSQIKYLENQIDLFTKNKNKIGKLKLTVDSFTRKSERELDNAKGDRWSRFYSPSDENKYKTTISLNNVYSIARHISCTFTNNYKACVALINSSIYVTKSNYRTAIQSIKFWGENAQKEQ